MGLLYLESYHVVVGCSRYNAHGESRVSVVRGRTVRGVPKRRVAWEWNDEMIIFRECQNAKMSSK